MFQEQKQIKTEPQCDNRGTRKMTHFIRLNQKAVEFNTAEEAYELLISTYPEISNPSKAKTHIEHIVAAHKSGFRFWTSSNLIDSFAIGGFGPAVYISINTPELSKDREIWTVPCKSY